MCIVSDGALSKYQTFDTYPPLPSLFTDFKIDVKTTGKDCLKFPSNANIRVEISRNETAGTLMERLDSTLLTTVCFDLIATKTSYRSKYMSEAQNICTHCDVGQYHESPITGRYNCKRCPSGAYQDQRGRYSCKKCAVGYYQFSEGQTRCRACPSDKCCPFEGMAKPLAKVNGKC